jgi:Flp pilus assembly protein TadD
MSEALSRRPRIQWVGLVLGAGVIVGLAATAHTQVGHWRNTVDLFSHTLESTGPNALAHRTLGVAYWIEGDHSRGEEHLRMAVQLDPSWPDARLVLALSLNQAGRFEEARLHFERARDDGADPGRVHGGLGVAAQQLGDDAEAAREYRAALKARPEEWEVVNNLAWLLATSRDRRIRDPIAAIDLASKAVVALPENAEFLGTLARAYAESGRFSEAVAAQQRAIDAVAPDAAPGTRARFEAELRGYRDQRTGSARP